MPALVVPNCVEVVINWETGVLNAANVMHVRDAPVTSADVDDIADIFATWVASAANGYKGITPTTTFFTTLSARDMSSVGGYATVRNVNTAGSDPGSALPPNATVCVTLRTLLNTGRGRGRVYTPPQVEAVVDDYGTILAGRRTDIITRFGNLKTDLDTLLNPNGGLAVLSRADVIANEVVTFTVDPVIDTQRRRLRN